MPKFSIGDVVSFVSHPFITETNNIVISGEHMMIPPIMVVIEVTDHSSAPTPQSNKYKCLWFSTKQNQFKESNFLENDLKNIETEIVDVSKMVISDKVALKTLNIELGKRRSFLNTESSHSGQKQLNNISALLTFISPIMYVVEIKPFDSEKIKKASEVTSHTKLYPSTLVKCKWFDSVSEKFSEAFIPQDALLIIPEVDKKLIIRIEKAIKRDRFLNLDGILFKPSQFSNRSGTYYLTGFNHITQQNQTINVDDLPAIKILKKTFLATAPFYSVRKKGVKKILSQSQTVRDLIKQAIGRVNNNYITIKYIDKLDIVTKRTISEYEIVIGEDEASSSRKMIEYVKAYCHLRNDIRHFKLDNILEANEINISF